MSEQTRHATPNLLISIHILWLLISSLLHSLLLSLFLLSLPSPLRTNEATLLLSSSNLLTPGISPRSVRPLSPSPALLLSSSSYSPSPPRFSPRFPPRRRNSNFQGACVCVCERESAKEEKGKIFRFYATLCARDSRVARSTDYLRPSLWGVTYYYLPLT